MWLVFPSDSNFRTLAIGIVTTMVSNSPYRESTEVYPVFIGAIANLWSFYYNVWIVCIYNGHTRVILASHQTTAMMPPCIITSNFYCSNKIAAIIILVEECTAIPTV